MAASESWLRARSRCSSASNDGGRTKTLTASVMRCRTMRAPCTSMTRTRSSACGEQLLGVLPAGAVQVAEDVRPLEKCVLLDQRLERRPADEIIVDPLLFPGAGAAARCRTGTAPGAGRSPPGGPRRWSSRPPTAPTRRTTGPGPGTRLLDILHLLPDALELGLGGDHGLGGASPSIFEPIVFSSRFISWTRKSSLRPHGSGPPASICQWSKWPRSRTSSSSTSDRATNRTTSCASARGSACASSDRPASRSRRRASTLALAVVAQPLELVDVAPAASPAAPSRSVSRNRPSVSRISTSASIASSSDRLEQRREIAAAASSARDRAPRCRISSTCGMRTTSDAVSAPVTRPRARAASSAAAIAIEQRFVQRHLRHGLGRRLDADRHLDAAARQPLLQPRAHARLGVAERRRRLDEQVEEAVVHRRGA